MDKAKIIQFQITVRQYYAQHGRHDLPWRLPEADGSFDPYKILVSESMLQQTQVNRVVPKYHDFLARFPDVKTLASATLGEALMAWSGLGYNRRAKFLWQAAQLIQTERAGQFPRTFDELIGLPGVGKNTAGAMMAYVFNQPVAFIETNIRSVYIYHFFHDEEKVPDNKILELVKSTLPVEAQDSRIWYWALMDYGTYLKQTTGNAARKSKSYAKQSAFAGSKRQIRGQVLRLLAQGPMSTHQLLGTLHDERARVVLIELASEGMIRYAAEQYQLA